MSARFFLFLTTLLLCGFPGNAHAQKGTFDFRDPKEISAVSLTIDSMLEPIVGYAKGLSGKIEFDPKNPLQTTGKIAVSVSSVQFANEGYTATAQNFALQKDKYPQIFFTLRKVLKVTQSATNRFQALVKADFTCRGVTTPLTVPVTANYFPGRAEERTNGKYKGDLLVIRTKFEVSRTKQGISEGIPEAMVADKIEVRVFVVGIRYAPGQKTPQSSAINQKPLFETWRAEIEDRDNALLVKIEANRDATAPSLRFTAPQGSLDAQDVKRVGDKLRFRIPNNPVIGEREGEVTFSGDTLTGLLKNKEETLRFHGRPQRATDGKRAKAVYAMRPAGAFGGLTLKVEGKSYTLEERMRFHQVPGVQIARFENFEVVESAAMGIANSETGEAVTPNTLFHAGGMGSPLVNVLALKLASEGKLDLMAEVNKVLKKPIIPENPLTQSHKITVLDLVNTTSGLTQYKFAGYRPGVLVPTLSDLLYKGDPFELDPLEVKVAPGTTNGAGVNGAILELVIEEVMGKPLPELMQTYVFAPFGMTYSTYEALPKSDARRNVSRSHYESGDVMLDALHYYPEVGETGLWTTAGDFAKALCQIQKLVAGKPNLILTQSREDLKKLVLTPKWFLGLMVGDNDYAYHGGDPYGFFANHSTHIKDGHGVVVMENRMMGWGLNNEVISAVHALHPVNKH